MEMTNPLEAFNQFQLSHEGGQGSIPGVGADFGIGVNVSVYGYSYNATGIVAAAAVQLLDPGGDIYRSLSESFIEDGVNSSISTLESPSGISIVSLGTNSKEKEPKTMVTTTVGFWPLGVGLLIICTLGLVGNIFSAIVLSRPKMRSTYSILTLGLTLCDGVYLFTKLLRYGLLSMFVHYSICQSYTEILYPILGPYLRALTFTAHTGSTYFTVALAVDRYISVCWPIQARSIVTKRRAYFLVISVFLFSILYNIPRWMEFHTEIKVDFDKKLDANVTLYSMEISTLRENPLYKTLYIFWSYVLFLFLLPFTTLSFFNYKIFRVVRESNKTREKLTSYQKREISFAMMLISIVAVFLICSTDYLVLDLLSYFKVSYSPFFDHLGNFLLSLNSAVNFLIYCAFGRKFRQEFYQATQGLFWSKKSQKTISSRIISGSVSAGRINKIDGENSTDSSKSRRTNGCQFQIK